MNTVKIISGTYGGRKIMTPGGATHPMGERERNALFNMIADKIEGAEVLDAYSGSGALGIEAISRGAKEVVFVDVDPIAMRTANMNCYDLRIPEEKIAFYRGSVSAFYKKFVKERGTAVDPRIGMMLATFPKKVDIILADPPYDDFNPREISRLANRYLDDEGTLVLSHPGEVPDLPGMELVKTHKYAAAHLSVYAKL